MAHCVHSDERERKAMKDNGVWVAHCPDSNINLISGTAPVRKMMNEGVRVTLGSDIAGGALLAMNQVVTAAIRASKAKRIETNWGDDFLTVAEAFYLGTTGGAKFLAQATVLPKATNCTRLSLTTCLCRRRRKSCRSGNVLNALYI